MVEGQDRMLESLQSVVTAAGAHLKTHRFPLCMWLWCISPLPSFESMSSRMQEKPFLYVSALQIGNV